MADRSVVIRVGANVSGVVNGMRTAKGAVEDFGKSATGYFSKNRAALDDLASTMGKVGLSAGALGAIAVRAFANFDEAMSAVEATGKDAAANIEQLGDLAIDMGAKTKYSATEAAGAIEEMLKAGVSAKEVIGGGLQGALDMAAAGNIEVAEAAAYASQAMNQFSLKGEDVPHIADLLAAAAGKANGEISDFGQALNQTGLVASDAGLSLEETTGGLAAFAQAGLLGSDAGTSFKTMLQRLNPQSKEAADLMKKLGLSAYDSKGRFVGLAEYAGRLKASMKDMTDEQRAAAMQTLFGSDAIRAANVLYREGEVGVRNWTKAVDDQGFAAETATTKMDNLKGDFEELTGALESAFITTAAGTDGPLRDLTQMLTGLTDAYNGLPQGMKDATMGAIGLTAAIGGGAWATSKALSSYEKMTTTFDSLGGSYERTTKKALLARGGALGVGLALGSLSDDIGEFDERAGIATDALSGMAVGFGVGGPWGAAIVGAIGLVKGFGDAHADAAAEIQAMVELYDQATGKMTAAARSKAVKDLSKPFQQGLFGTGFGAVDMTPLEAAKTAGIDLKTLTDAAMGSGRAMQEVTARLDELWSIAKSGDLNAEADRLGVSSRDLADATAYLGDHIDENAEKWREAGARARDAAVATAGEIKTTREFAAALGDVPPGVETELKLLGYKPTELQLDEIIRRYELTPEEVQTVLAALDRATPLIEDVDRKRNRLDGSTATVRLGAIDAATGAIYAARTALQSLDGRSATVSIRTKGAKPNLNDVYGRADGGLAVGSTWKRFADGGIDEYGRPVQRTPQIRHAAQGAVVWGEPETGWEAYISGKPGKKDRNRAIASEAVGRLGGSVQWFADGGFTEAVSARELTSMRIRVRDLKRALRETETYGKNKKRRLALRGLDRLEARQELREAEAELREQNSIRRTMKRRGYKTSGAYNRAMQRSQDAREKAREDAENAKENRQSVASSFADGLGSDAFKSPASLERALATMLRDGAEHTQLLAQLKKAGASPWLLEQLVKAGPSRATNRTARALLADTDRLRRLNAMSAGIVTTSNQYAALTTGKGFTPTFSGAAGFDAKAVAKELAAAYSALPPTQLTVDGRQAGALVQAG
ncbi:MULTISPECIES: phage tail tape measure protein, partial [unclassified Aeromicrobium]|uniref:phage tail tape measure protein n=1 Tax=unclassified Aeromicrobium TaxID=2633570 RepID=UPI00396B18DA